jgi:hypothetical protein
MSGPPFRFYLPEPECHVVPPEVNRPAPRSGCGTVYITPHRDGSWAASWQDEREDDDAEDLWMGITSLDQNGTWDDIVAWAKSQPAKRILVFNHSDGDYRLLA